ncbi:hypothetical protein ACFQU7_41555 [Pseudoroseomonas wenyumeiae]
MTNILNHVLEDGRAFLAEHGKNAPIRRAAEPGEIAEVIAFLASNGQATWSAPSLWLMVE